MDFFCVFVVRIFHENQRPFTPLRPFVFILQYVLFKIRLYCEVLNVNIPKKRHTYKRKDIFLPDYFL